VLIQKGIHVNDVVDMAGTASISPPRTGWNIVQILRDKPSAVKSLLSPLSLLSLLSLYGPIELNEPNGPNKPKR